MEMIGQSTGEFIPPSQQDSGESVSTINLSEFFQFVLPKLIGCFDYLIETLSSAGFKEKRIFRSSEIVVSLRETVCGGHAVATTDRR
ncbi:hypothetical protein [Bradyrhizobium sp. Ec3.3]|uniref:hypothetical protein n=1 Tax=Bradyrhizobium sp. Ec3.3 TaxID=189753 RepID=UPI000483272E|nr:hypothetical protein [Bradyrhizobium sp. Ec3.3]